MVYSYFVIYPPVDLQVSETLYPKHAPTDFAPHAAPRTTSGRLLRGHGGHVEDIILRASWLDTSTEPKLELNVETLSASARNCK